ncbi:hypothetical protein VTN02DRAFT_5640 [Thermoascus thermophilus]
MSSAAQEEVDRLFNQKERFSCHPEDRNNSDDESSSQSDDESQNYYVHSESETESSHNMASRAAAYTIPTTQFDANTGPKGVITDAQSFERARKLSFRRTLLSVAGFDNFQSSNKSGKEETKLLRGRRPTQGSATSEEDEEQFMRKWRETRMQELQQRARSKTGPSRRMYGTVETVDAVRYLDAIEKAPADTVVVVCIYDPESTVSNIVEDCLVTVARKYMTTRFVKLHYEIAEMNHVQPPALLAYKGGDVFATIVDILTQLPDGRDCSPSSLEQLLIQHRVI